jgi:hypothetical protein
MYALPLIDSFDMGKKIIFYGDPFDFLLSSKGINN